MPGPFTDAAEVLEQQVTDNEKHIEFLNEQLDALTVRVSALEAASGGGTPEPPDPEPPEELTWINKPADSRITIDGDACTVESPPRASAFQMTADGKNVKNSVNVGETSNVGRARSEFRTNEYIPDSWHIEFECVVGQSYQDTSSDHYNVHSQFHPNNNSENPSASINYQNNEFQVQRSEGTGSTIKTVDRVPVRAGDRVKVVWDVKFATNNQGQLRCVIDNLTTGVMKTVQALNVNLGKPGRLHNFKLGTYRAEPDVAYEVTYYDIVISHPAQGLSADEVA